MVRDLNHIFLHQFIDFDASLQIRSVYIQNGQNVLIIITNVTITIWISFLCCILSCFGSTSEKKVTDQTAVLLPYETGWREEPLWASLLQKWLWWWCTIPSCVAECVIDQFIASSSYVWCSHLGRKIDPMALKKKLLLPYCKSIHVSEGEYHVFFFPSFSRKCSICTLVPKSPTN